MILSDNEILTRMHRLEDLPYLDRTPAQQIVIDPFDIKNLQGASYDVHISGTIEYKGRTIDVAKMDSQTFLLPPHGAVLVSLQEFVVTPTDCVCRLEGVSSIGRQFVIVHCTAGWGDPGYAGNYTLEVVNLDPDNFFAITPGMRIGQLTWLQLDQPAERIYKGRYQFDRTVQGAKP